MTPSDWNFVLWWLSESGVVALFPPYRGQVTTTTPIPVQGSQKIYSLGGSGGRGEETRERRKRTLEKKLCCCYLPCEPPWEPHVKTDTCSLAALSQGPGRVRVCLYDSKLLGEPLIWVCGTVLVKSPAGNKLQAPPHAPTPTPSASRAPR